MERLSQIQEWTERLQKEVIGEPQFTDRQTFEYPEVTIEVVSILKLIRAVQGLKSLELLCLNGLFIDMGTIYRCVNDCVNEIYFLLENYPDKSSHVEKFIENFSQTTIDQDHNLKTEAVLSKKILSARTRVLSQSPNDYHALKMITGIYKAFSGYVHSNYAHIMQVYGGRNGNLSFNLDGVLSESQVMEHLQLVEQAEIAVQHVIAFMAHRFGQHQLHSDVISEINTKEK